VLQSSGQTLSYRERRYLLQQRRQLAHQQARPRQFPAHTQSHQGRPRVVTSRTTRRSPLIASAPPARSRASQLSVLSTTTRPAISHRSPEPQKLFISPVPQANVKSASLKRTSISSARRETSRPRPLLYPVRLLVTGLGVGAIAGTILAIVDPTPRSTLLTGSAVLSAPSDAEPALSSPTVASNLSVDATLAEDATQPTVNQPRHPQQIALDTLKSEIGQMAAAQKDLVPGMYFLNADTGATLDISGDQTFSAASTIKVPVLLAFFQAIDAGEIRLDDKLIMRADLIATESGTMQYQPPGTEFSALETAEKMITISDNTATNMLIDLLGGADRLNDQFRSWGLKHTEIHNPLPDLDGTNTISPQDLSNLMLKLSRGELLSVESRDQTLEIMRNTVTKTLLPRGLAPDATIAHKTGDIGSVVGDTGLIEMPNGQRYVATVMVERPHNDPRAQELIRKISQMTYQVFSQPQSPPQ
jgi:beta-lactamase class A